MLPLLMPVLLLNASLGQSDIRLRICDRCPRYVTSPLNLKVAHLFPGIEPEEGIGRPAADFAHPDDAIQLYNAYQFVSTLLLHGISLTNVHLQRND